MLGLGRCHRLKCNTNSERKDLWAVTSAKHVNIDTVISANGADYNKASTTLRTAHQTEACNHRNSYTIRNE